MAEGTFVQEGLAIDYTPNGAAVTGGDVVVQNNVVGIAKTDIGDGKLGALAISGVFDVVKAEEAFATVGANIFWDDTGTPVGGTATGAATATATGNTWMGFVLVAAETTDTTVRILLRSTVTLTAESFSLADLKDIDEVDYTADDLLIGNGTSKYVDLPLSGPFNLSALGLLSMDAATVAADGSIQGDAAAIADGFTLVSAANGALGVKLPTAVAGGLAVVKNNAAAVLLLYPFLGDAIDALGANAAMSVPPYATLTFVAYDDTTWYSSALPEQALDPVQIPVQDFKKPDLVTPLPAAGDGTTLGLVAGTHGTNGPSLQGKDATGLTATTTDVGRILLPLPADYVDGGDVKIRCHAGMLTTVADTSATLDCQAYETDEEAGIGSDLCTTDAQDINDLVLADVDFVIDGAGLVAGDVLDLELTTVSIQTGTATETIPFIGAVKLLYDRE